jgi:hypothetical protein
MWEHFGCHGNMFAGRCLAMDVFSGFAILALNLRITLFFLMISALLFLSKFVSLPS